MTHTFRTTTAALALGAATVLATAASAVTFTGTATGSWENIDGSSGISLSNGDSGATADVNWGTPSTTGGSDNLWSFDGVGSDGGAGWSTDSASLFAIGDFFYRNGSVSGHDFESADLSVTLDITSPLSSTQPYAFEFDVINTPNTGSTGCCDDIASIINTNADQTFSYDGEDFTLKLFGFSGDGGTTLTTDFNSPEGSTANATLYAQIIQPPPVPLPAAGWLLLAGIGGLGALRRFRKA